MKLLRCCLAALLGMILATAGNVQAQDSGSGKVLDTLFEKFRAATDPAIIRTLEAAIWEQWTMVPDLQQRGAMMQGIAEMQQGRLDQAVAIFTQLIAQAPELSEAWNKRATAYWLMGNFSASIADVCETVKREPRHFGAYSGLGMIRAELGEYARAVAAFELARKWNPHIVGIDDEIARLRGLGGEPASETDPLGCGKPVAERRNEGERAT